MLVDPFVKRKNPLHDIYIQRVRNLAKNIGKRHCSVAVVIRDKSMLTKTWKDFKMGERCCRMF
jgi:hypothetical protein